MTEATAARPDLESAGLRLKITWLTVFRTVATTVLMIGLAARLVSRATADPLTTSDAASFVVCGVVYLVTVINGVLIRRGRVGLGAAWSQVATDLLLALSLVFLTGGPESPFVFVYSITIIAASVLLFRRGAMVAAALAAVTHVALVFAMSSAGLTGAIPRQALFLSVGLQIAAQFLIAVLSGYVAEQLSRTGGQLKAREEDLQQLEAFQRQIVDAIPSGLITCDASGRVTYTNPAASEILGVTPEVRGRPIESLLPGVGRHRMTSGRFELEAKTPVGSRTLGLSLASMGKGDELLIVFQDLTELRRMESELRRIDHLAGLGRTTAQLAHEVRNPLAALRGAAQLLSSDVAAESPPGRLIHLVMREADRLAALVESYLRLARPSKPTCAPTRLDRVVRETVEMLRFDPSVGGVAIEQSLEPVDAVVDAAQVKQALINLLRNAVAAAGRAGSVRVEASLDERTPALRVWDSAGTIPQEDLDRIFEPFFTTREGGTGLGLSTVKAIVTAHGGTISVRSNPAQGTTFEVRFPIQGAPHE